MKNQEGEVYYLLLPFHANEEPFLIKRCNAISREEATRIFLDRLSKYNKEDLYEVNDLLPFIKHQNELTNKEKQLIKQEGEIVDL